MRKRLEETYELIKEEDTKERKENGEEPKVEEKYS